MPSPPRSAKAAWGRCIEGAQAGYNSLRSCEGFPVPVAAEAQDAPTSLLFLEVSMHGKALLTTLICLSIPGAALSENGGAKIDHSAAV